MSLIAINVLLDPDTVTVEKAQAGNARLREDYPDGFALDANHAPHITIFQQLVDSSHRNRRLALRRDGFPAGHASLPVGDPAGQFHSVAETAAVTLSAGMTTKTPGKGQVYLSVQKDGNGKWLQGGNQYTLRTPPNPPVAQFWGMILDDTETRCFIDNKHAIAGLDSRKDLVKNADGSVDLLIGPAAPEGKEKNWIPTAPDRGWFGLFRLYAPTEAYFDRSWALPDVERVK